MPRKTPRYTVAPRYTVGKAALAEHLGWTRPKLDRRLETDPDFPVAKRGSRRGAWEFDVEAVDAYLAGVAAAPSPVEPHDEPAEHQGETTARRRKDEAQAALLEDKLRLSRRQLLVRDEVLSTVMTAAAELGKGLDGLADVIVKALALPETAGELIRAETDELRRDLADKIQKLLAEPDEAEVVA